jgi:hypothetical protein
MPLDRPVHVVGTLNLEPSGLFVLRVDGGGFWQLHQVRKASQLVGQRVEISGHRIGFNELSCDSIWRAGEPPPRPRDQFGLEYLLPAAAIAFGLIAALAVWLG